MAGRTIHRKANGTAYVYSVDMTRPVPQPSIEYVIDGQNRRVGKRVSGALVQGGLYDGARVVAELDGAGAVVSRFVYATSGHSPDLMIRGGVVYRFVMDHLGSPRLVVDADTGVVAQRMDFDEWGVVTADTNPGFRPFGFAGGIWDRDVGLVRFGARDYDALVGRWDSKDPIGFGGGLNLFGYVEGDPVNWVDPSGLTVYECTRWGVGWTSYVRHRYLCVVTGTKTTCAGHGAAPKDDVFDRKLCKAVNDNDVCMDVCVRDRIENDAPPYNLLTNNCYHWANRIQNECVVRCALAQ